MSCDCDVHLSNSLATTFVLCIAVPFGRGLCTSCFLIFAFLELVLLFWMDWEDSERRGPWTHHEVEITQVSP